MTAYQYPQRDRYAGRASAPNGRRPGEHGRAAMNRAAAGRTPSSGRASSAGRAPSRRGASGAGAPSYGRDPRQGRRGAYGRNPREYSGRRPPRRGRGGLPREARLAIFAVAAIALVAVAALGVSKLVNGVREASVERFVDNVYVNGVRMTGYTYDEGAALLAQVRDQRLNTTYTLTYSGKSWPFKPADYGAELNYDSELAYAWNLGHVGSRADRSRIVKNLQDTAAEFNSTLTYDEEALEDFIENLAEQIDEEPVDAEVAVTEEKPVIITASRVGLELDQDKTRENLVALIETGEGDTKLPVREVQPAIASDNMEMKVVAKFSTDVSFRGVDSRANVRQALSYFNGYVVNPGETCDFNAVVGPRTVGRGFREAPEYAGNEKIKGVGGGVCQASTTLYNAVIMANMTILERHNHSMTVQYVDPSQDAAVEYGVDGKNFVFRNDTEHSIYIYTDVSKENAVVTIYGTRPEYHYELVSVIVDEQKSQRKRYEYDYSGKYVYYITDPPKLKTAGHGSCHSEGWVVAYDWDTKQEVSREQISYDAYVPGMNVYWKGVHDEKGNVVDPTQTTEEGT